MGGVLGAMLGSGGVDSVLELTTGQQSMSFKGFFTTQTGFATAAQSVTGVAFGSVTDNTWKGFTVIGIYNETTNVGNQGTKFVVSGDASALSASMLVDGVDQQLGAGVFSGGKTTFTSSPVATDPFGAVSSTHDVILS